MPGLRLRDSLNRRQLFLEIVIASGLGRVRFEIGPQSRSLDQPEATCLTLQRRVRTQVHQGGMVEGPQNAKVGKALPAAEHDVELRKLLAANAMHIEINDELAQRATLTHVRGQGAARNEWNLSTTNVPGFGSWLAMTSGPRVEELVLDWHDWHTKLALSGLGKAIKRTQQIEVVEFDDHALRLIAKLMPDWKGCL